VLEPSELTIADFSLSAHIYVELARCADAPAAHVVDLTALVPEPDAGDAVRVLNLLTLAEGADGDVAGDGAIDVQVPNPFGSTVPANTDITLRFTARSSAPGGCTGGSVDVSYRTGPPI
jgi:hypothetical protein